MDASAFDFRKWRIRLDLTLPLAAYHLGISTKDAVKYEIGATPPQPVIRSCQFLEQCYAEALDALKAQIANGDVESFVKARWPTGDVAKSSWRFAAMKLFYSPTKRFDKEELKSQIALLESQYPACSGTEEGLRADTPSQPCHK